MSKAGRYISPQAIVNDWLTELKLNNKVEEDTAFRWASDRAKEMTGTETLNYSLALLDIRNFLADIPEGFHSVYLAGSLDDRSKVWNREMLVGYTEKVYGTDCEVEINLLCPKCNSKTCACDNSVIDVRVDELYMKARPYLWAMTSDKYVGYSATITDGFPTCGPSADFKLMKPRRSNSVLWNSEYFLGICNRVAVPHCYTFEIHGGQFITDMRDGQVFLAYLRYNIDEDGYTLLPDNIVAINAVKAYLTERYMWRRWMDGDGNQNDRLRHLDAKRESDMLFAQAMSELEVPGPDEFKANALKHLYVDRDRYHYGG